MSIPSIMKNIICISLITISSVCHPQSNISKQVDDFLRASKSGDKLTACSLGNQLLNGDTTKIQAKALSAIQDITIDACLKAMEQQFNSPRCQKYQNAKARCAAAANYPVCMNRMGANLEDYAFVCGD